MAVTDKTPMCSLCSKEMVRLKRLGSKKDTPIFACGSGLPGKVACDGVAAKLGAKFD